MHIAFKMIGYIKEKKNKTTYVLTEKQQWYMKKAYNKKCNNAIFIVSMTSAEVVNH